jgi:glutathione S-transferase
MQLIGYMDSPYVRRVAVTAQLLGIPYEHRELSVFRDYEALRKINPQVKVPTLVCDDGQILMDSSLIIDYLVAQSPGKTLMPTTEQDYVRALYIVGTALVAMEKTVQLIYELKHRPESTRFQDWIDRLVQQLNGALSMLEASVGDGETGPFGEDLTQADVSTAIAWSFTQLHFPEFAEAKNYPGLVRFSARVEALPAFKACPLE